MQKKYSTSDGMAPRGMNKVLLNRTEYVPIVHKKIDPMRRDSNVGLCAYYSPASPFQQRLRDEVNYHSLQHAIQLMK